MRLVWVVIPLVLFGIVGVQESFAEDFSIDRGKYNSHNRDVVFDSPKKQFESGIERHEILCNDRLYLIYKTSGGSPVCVKMYFSAPKLIERGWATLGETLLVITTDKEMYSVGEKITITMQNEGETLLLFSGAPIFHIRDEANNGIDLPLDVIRPPTDNISGFDTLASTVFVWDQTNRIGEKVNPGTYTIFANYMKHIPSRDLQELGYQWIETTETFEIIPKKS